MAALTSALIAGAATLGGAALASNSQRRATNAVTSAANDSNALQAAIFQQQRDDLAPWRASGASALTEINRRLGLGQPQNQTVQGQGVAPVLNNPSIPMQGTGSEIYDGRVMPTNMVQAGGDSITQSMAAPSQPYDKPQINYGEQPGQPTQPVQNPGPAGSSSDPQNRYGGFYASPGYQFRMDEGNRAITGNRAASGMLQSGDTLRALNRYGQDYASNEYNTQLNQLFNVAGLGQTATGQQNALSSNYANNVTANNQNSANALSSSYANQGNIWGNALGNIGGYAAYSLGNRNNNSTVPNDLTGLY